MAPLGIVAVCVTWPFIKSRSRWRCSCSCNDFYEYPLWHSSPMSGPRWSARWCSSRSCSYSQKLLSALGVPPAVLLLAVAFAGLGTYAGVMRIAFHAAWNDLTLLRRSVVPAWASLAPMIRRRRAAAGDAANLTTALRPRSTAAAVAALSRMRDGYTR